MNKNKSEWKRQIIIINNYNLLKSKNEALLLDVRYQKMDIEFTVHVVKVMQVKSVNHVPVDTLANQH